MSKKSGQNILPSWIDARALNCFNSQKGDDDNATNIINKARVLNGMDISEHIKRGPGTDHNLVKKYINKKFRK